MGRHRHTTGHIPPTRAGHSKGTHRKQGPARTGLLGASAALTLGAMAMGAGMVPQVDEHFSLDDTRDIQAQQQEDRLRSSATAPAMGGREHDNTSRDKDRTTSATPTESAQPTESAEPTPPEPSVEPSSTAPAPTPSSVTTKPRPTTAAPSVVPRELVDTTGTDLAGIEAAAVLRLVNEERAKAGCQPLSHDGPLAKLATSFSEDMAGRDFFSHTDPDGRSPWDRAEDAGIGNLGGENIARGQRDAAAVMEAWMNSDGHRANILNCDFTTLGVGVHLGEGGPWWTQNFGY